MTTNNNCIKYGSLKMLFPIISLDPNGFQNILNAAVMLCICRFEYQSIFILSINSCQLRVSRQNTLL